MPTMPSTIHAEQPNLLQLFVPRGSVPNAFVFDRHAAWVSGSIFALLIMATIVGRLLVLRGGSPESKRTIDNMNARINAWWIMVLVFAAALAGGRIGVVVLFAFVSFHALREVVTLAPSRRGDHRTLFWAFFVVLPLHYYMLYCQQYGLFIILIPVYGFLFFAIRSAMCGDCTHYLERAAKVFWGVMIGVYCLSHAPALLMLEIPGLKRQEWKLIVFLVVITQLSDVLQYVWGKLIGKRKIAPLLSPNKTVEGYVGGTLSATLVGAAMGYLCGFDLLPSILLAFAITQMGFFGGLVMSAIKRDAGVKDYGHLIAGHGGAMDRVDSLAFAAPVFFHLVRFFYSLV
jgi:phosphatidate cytidylyltransferase